MDPEDFIRQLSSASSDPKHQALEDLLDLCESEPAIVEILTRRGSHRDQLFEIYQILLSTGAGQWEGGHWVPASALATPATLDFVLEQKGTLPWEHIAVLLLEYFERNESGPVPLKMRGPADPVNPLRAIWELNQKGRRSR